MKSEKCRKCKYYYAQAGFMPHNSKWEVEEVEMCCRANLSIKQVSKCNGFELCESEDEQK
jgi:hypothetical protein